MIKGKTKGRDQLLRRMESLAAVPTMSAGVGMKATSGSVARAKSGSADVSRGAGENIVVLRTQAKEGRDIAFLSKAEERQAKQYWKGAVRRILSSPGAAEPALQNAARQLARFIIRAFVSHIYRGMGRKGRVKPVTAGTQRQKDREVGPGKPPLVRTGQLLRSFVARVRKI